MATFPEYADYLSQSLIDGISEVSKGTSEADAADNNDLETLVNDLVAAIPYYQNDEVRIAHVDALCRQMAQYMPQEMIAAQPDMNGSISYHYYYNGSYSNMQDAFFHGVSHSDASSKLDSEVSAAVSALNHSWWGNYCVALLTDALRLSPVNVAINSNKLSDALNGFNSDLTPGLPPTYLPVFTDGYGPTKTAFHAILDTGQAAEAAQILNDGIDSPLFQTNFNTIINQPGDGKDAAMWFLFNNWIALQALGYPDVDAAIEAHKDAGLVVPDQLGPVNWWTGHYKDWYERLDGNDVLDPAPSMFEVDMPENWQTYYPPPQPPTSVDITYPCGYAYSLGEWGPLAWYKP